MPRYNVQNEKGEWACFSSIVDDFVTGFMPRDEYQKWRIKEYGVHCGEIEEANIMDYDEAIRTFLCAHGENKRIDGEAGNCACDECRFWKEHKCTILDYADEIVLSDEGDEE